MKASGMGTSPGPSTTPTRWDRVEPLTSSGPLTGLAGASGCCLRTGTARTKDGCIEIPSAVQTEASTESQLDLVVRMLHRREQQVPEPIVLLGCIGTAGCDQIAQEDL